METQEGKATIQPQHRNCSDFLSRRYDGRERIIAFSKLFTAKVRSPQSIRNIKLTAHQKE